MSEETARRRIGQELPMGSPTGAAQIISGKARLGALEASTVDIPVPAVAGFHVDKDGNWSVGGTDASSGTVAVSVSGILTALLRLAVQQSGDTGPRYALDASAGLLSGSGTGTTDVSLVRNAANEWAIGSDDSLGWGTASKLAAGDYIEIPEKDATYANISRVQTATAGDTDATVTLTWGTATTANNFLVLAVAADATITTPTDYTLATAVVGTSPYVALYYKENAGTQASIDIAASGATAIAVVGAEYSGIETAASIDKQASATGTSTTAASGTTASTAQTVELWLAAIGNRDALVPPATQSSPTNSFQPVGSKEQLTTKGDGIRIGLYERTTAATGTASTAVTLGASDDYSGKIATFLADAGAALTGSANKARIYAVDNGGKTEIQAIFGSGVAQVIAAEP